MSEPVAPLAAGPSRVMPLDVVVSGLVFHDLVLGLPTAPRPGTEVWADDSAESPGGIANFAVALARLGLRTGLAAAFGNDDHGNRCWQQLEEAEGIDLGYSRKLDGWATPLTVALAYDNDRALVTRGTTPPLSADELLSTPPTTKAVAAHIGPWRNDWLAKSKAAGSIVFADVGWDPSEQWDPAVLDQLEHCDVFLPNAVEAMNYTRTATPSAALDRLAEKVPVVVVSNGADGALAIDTRTGERVAVPAFPVQAVDTTGAGDVFAAGFIAATLWQLTPDHDGGGAGSEMAPDRGGGVGSEMAPDRGGGAGLEMTLAERVRFASLAAALSVTRLGGANAAPTWADLAAWHDLHPEDKALAALISTHSGR